MTECIDQAILYYYTSKEVTTCEFNHGFNYMISPTITINGQEIAHSAKLTGKRNYIPRKSNRCIYHSEMEPLLQANI